MSTLNTILLKLSKLFKDKNYSLVTAESCTGGGLAYFLTKNSHTSSLLERGYVVYSIAAKEDVLNISPLILQTKGLVSKETVEAMAKSALEKSKAQISIAITGLDAAATKKNKFKQPGIVWMCCVSVDKKICTKVFRITGNREAFCEKTILDALNMLVDFVSEK